MRQFAYKKKAFTESLVPDVRKRHGKMATYLKRTSKLFDISLNRTSTEVNLRDLICPVCRGILIEPVTLPCTHNLCLRCLKGTFEHNSLTCPMCRVRVGSWLRTATKSETLVNSSLWELIRARFPKEVEGKHNGDEGDIELDSGFTSKKIILSAAGEIRREYEVQLKIAEEEMRRQRESERLANEVLIRKIHAEEQKQLAQLKQDQLLAKSLAKRQMLSKEKNSIKNQTDSRSGNSTGNEAKIEPKTVETEILTNSQLSVLRVEKNNQNLKIEPEVSKSSVSIISKIRAEKSFVQKSMPINVVTRTLKHQNIGKFTNSSSSNFSSEPSCSTQIYGTRIKEELHVPIDILSSKKKSLGVEVCMTTGDNDERIGSAESAGSHDSINQEIHHFKPIKPIPRTALKMSNDGRPIDPKLVRVIPIVKRVSNVVPKPPSPSRIKRILGCSWSAFRGKARQNLELRRNSSKSETEKESKNSATMTTLLQPNQLSSKLQKSQISDTVRRLDLAPDSNFDSNKNYAKSINRILNGTRVSKKLILDNSETLDSCVMNKSSKLQKNNNTTKKNLWNKKIAENSDESSSCCSPITEMVTKIMPKNNEESSTIENIAERIKRRKISEIREKIIVESEINENFQRKTRRHPKGDKIEADTLEENCASKRKQKIGTSVRTKRRKTEEENSWEKNDTSIDLSSGKGRNERKKDKNDSIEEVELENGETSVSSLPQTKDISGENSSDIDDKIIEEQQRMERLILQEKKDFELARRLQAQFDDMERIAGRTRGSRRAMANIVTVESVGVKNERLKITADTAKRGNTSRKIASNKSRRRSQKNSVK